jgi:hypothetical protein
MELFRQLLACLLVLGLTLPPGWCCNVLAEAEASCCSHAAQPGEPTAPLAPVQTCKCCDHPESAVRVISERCPVELTCLEPLLPLADLAGPPGLDLWESIEPPGSPPPHRVLHCTWLC